MLVSRFNPPLCCVKILNDETLNARRDSRPNLPYSSPAIEVFKVQLLHFNKLSTHGTSFSLITIKHKVCL